MPVTVIDRDLGWSQVMEAAKAVHEEAPTVTVGVHDSPKSRELNIAEYAAVNEFGSQDGKIPSRSFLRSTYDENRDRLITKASDLLNSAVTSGKMTVRGALSLIGRDLRDRVKEKIMSDVPPPNAEATLRSKLSRGRGAKTLVDTRAMYRSITYQVGGRKQAVAGEQAGASEPESGDDE